MGHPSPADNDNRPYDHPSRNFDLRECSAKHGLDESLSSYPCLLQKQWLMSFDLNYHNHWRLKWCTWHCIYDCVSKHTNCSTYDQLLNQGLQHASYSVDIYPVRFLMDWRRHYCYMHYYIDLSSSCTCRKNIFDWLWTTCHQNDTKLPLVPSMRLHSKWVKDLGVQPESCAYHALEDRSLHYHNHFRWYFKGTRPDIDFQKFSHLQYLDFQSVYYFLSRVFAPM